MLRKLLVRGLPPELKAALVAEAGARGVSQNDVACEILGRHFGVEHKPSGRRGATPPGNESTQVLLRMSPGLYERIGVAKLAQQRPEATIVIRVLARHYELDHVLAA